MKTGELLNQAYKRELGYSCLGVKIKPVHVANGLFRAVAGGATSSTRLLNRTVCRYNLISQAEINPTSRLIEEYPDAWGDLSRSHHREELDRLRALLRGVVGADGAVFPTETLTSYTLSHTSHITTDPSDGGVGAFLASLPKASDDGDDFIAVVREFLDADHDEVTTLLVPLAGAAASERRSRRGPSLLEPTEDRRTSESPLLGWAARGLERVARWEQLHAAKAGALQRVVTFGCVTILLHMAHRASELGLGSRPPLLLCYVSGHAALQSASNQTYRLALRSVDRLAAEGVAAALVDQFDLSQSADRRALIQERLEFKGRRNRSAALEELVADLDAPSKDQFVRALADVLLEDNDGNTAADYWRSLGVRVGLLVPRGSRGLAKRIEPSPQVLTVLMTSLLEPDDRIPYTDFLALMAEKTGFFVGGLHSDVTLLRDGSVFEATEADLADNSNAFKRHLIDAGFAREYADGVTIVSLQGVK
jgi:hypothetical protein